MPEIKQHGDYCAILDALAAANQDIDALRLLIRYGADLSILSRIDEYATPLEEAGMLNKTRAVEFLEGLIR